MLKFTYFETLAISMKKGYLSVPDSALMFMTKELVLIFNGYLLKAFWSTMSVSY